jgi:hypothetical protein
MRAAAASAAFGVLLAGCGGAEHAATTTGGSLTKPPPLPPHTETLYTSAGWTVTRRGDTAALYHFSRGRWRVDRSHAVRIEILGPKPDDVAPNPPQVAIAMRAKQPLVESALWVDDLHLFEKGGGSPTNGTIYGAPANPLGPGMHVAVGYARTAFGGSVVAWVFRVRKR